MSWIAENYEKVVLGASVVVALGIGAAVLTEENKGGEEIRNPVEVNEYVVAQAESLTSLKEAIESPQDWGFTPHNEYDLTVFVAFPLYGIKGKSGIHELHPNITFDGIPLEWWKENKLDDYQYANAGDKDADDDGFTNKEEFFAETSPIYANRHPDFIMKLKFVKALKSGSFRIQWSRLDDKRSSFTFKAGRAPSSLDFAGVGDTFPKEPRNKAHKNRFKILEKGRGINPTTNREENFYLLKDLKPIKAGLQYKLWYSDRFIYYEWSGMFKLNTPNGGESFIVEEGAEFSLPFREGGKGYKFLLREKHGEEFGEPNIEMTVDRVKKVVPLE